MVFLSSDLHSNLKIKIYVFIVMMKGYSATNYKSKFKPQKLFTFTPIFIQRTSLLECHAYY